MPSKSKRKPQTRPITESRIDATARLRREGRWDEATAFREAQRQRLRSEGLPRQKAVEAAWAAMVKKFQPLPPAKPPGIVATNGKPLNIILVTRFDP